MTTMPVASDEINGPRIFDPASCGKQTSKVNHRDYEEPRRPRQPPSSCSKSVNRVNDEKASPKSTGSGKSSRINSTTTAENNFVVGIVPVLRRVRTSNSIEDNTEKPPTPTTCTSHKADPATCNNSKVVEEEAKVESANTEKEHNPPQAQLPEHNLEELEPVAAVSSRPSLTLCEDTLKAVAVTKTALFNNYSYSNIISNVQDPYWCVRVGESKSSSSGDLPDNCKPHNSSFSTSGNEKKSELQCVPKSENPQDNDNFQQRAATEEKVASATFSCDCESESFDSAVSNTYNYVPVGFEVSLACHQAVSCEIHDEKSNTNSNNNNNQGTETILKLMAQEQQARKMTEGNSAHENNNHDMTSSTNDNPISNVASLDEATQHCSNCNDISDSSKASTNAFKAYTGQTASSSSDCGADISAPPSVLEDTIDDNYNANSHSGTPPRRYAFGVCVKKWTRFTQWLHYGISQFVLVLSMKAARNPLRCISLIFILSVTLIATGLLTNFNVDVDENSMFAPTSSLSLEHASYIDQVQGFPTSRRSSLLILHANGENVIGIEPMRRLFAAVDAIKALPDYSYICSHDDRGPTDSEGQNTCSKNDGPTFFWYDNTTFFEQEMEASGDNATQVLQETISQDRLPDGKPVIHQMYFGLREFDDNDNIVSAQAMFYYILLPDVGDDSSETYDFEGQIIDTILLLREEWQQETGNIYRVELHTPRGIPDELTRAINNDIPLVPGVFIIMASFTCFVFYRRDKIQSRSILGLGSIVTIVMSLMSGYGTAFIIGIPFTSMTQILPFVVFGVGLDDTFIITGAFFRTDPRKNSLDRIKETLEDTGNSISLTTITTVTAFSLGCVTSIPSILWLCQYAILTIFIDFIYQITFFVAIIVLDERRIQARRRDCCVCIVVPPDDDKEQNERRQSDVNPMPSTDVDADVSEVTDDSLKQPTTVSADKRPTQEIQEPLVDKIMAWYADHLLLPRVRVLVLVVFAAFLGGCAYSATKLEQKFSVSDFVPTDSYTLDLLEANDNYKEQVLSVTAFFRHVDQADEVVREQQIAFLEDLSRLEFLADKIDLCWVLDFYRMQQNTTNEYFSEYSYLFESNLTFYEQLNAMLNVPEIRDVYGDNIAFDEDGNIETSRCYVPIIGLDLDIVKDQIDLLRGIREVAADQEINQGRQVQAFFAFDRVMFIWEFYMLAGSELQFTTISGVLAITVIGFLLIPHWSAACFVTPLIVVLYVGLLGTLQFAGLYINPLTYVCLVISIGLLVDFLMHIILRYYESTESTREGKVKDTLRTMGASILVGGLSTCLGVIPLAFSGSGIFKTVFISFLAMVTLGLAHGLILLPVLLSYFGPVVCVRMSHHALARELHIEEGPSEESSERVPHRVRGSTLDERESLGMQSVVTSLVDGPGDESEAPCQTADEACAMTRSASPPSVCKTLCTGEVIDVESSTAECSGIQPVCKAELKDAETEDCMPVLGDDRDGCSKEEAMSTPVTLANNTDLTEDIKREQAMVEADRALSEGHEDKDICLGDQLTCTD